MKLYTFFRSSAAFRVRIALNLKGLRYQSEPKSFAEREHRASAYREVNPQGLIPALDIGGTVLSQSLAIIEYLDEVHPHPPLLPAEPIAKAQVRSMALAIACDIHPLNNLRVLDYLRDWLQRSDAEVRSWYHHWVGEGFAGLEAQARAHSSAQRYCFADNISLADVCLVPQIFNARRFDIDLTPFPTLTRISAHLEALAEFAAARPELQPDAK